MPWWGCIALGVGLIILVTLLYMNRDSQKVYFDGGSPKVVTMFTIIIGSVLVILCIFGYFFPGILKWMELYSKVAENLSNIYEISLFAVLQALLFFGLFYTIIYKAIIRREKSDLLTGVLFFTVLSGVYWVWIFWADKFEDGYKAPFQYFYKLIFE